MSLTEVIEIFETTLSLIHTSACIGIVTDEGLLAYVNPTCSSEDIFEAFVASLLNIDHEITKSFALISEGSNLLGAIFYTETVEVYIAKISPSLYLVVSSFQHGEIDSLKTTLDVIVREIKRKLLG